MNKILKIILIVLGIFILCIVLDIVSIYKRNKPIFVIYKDSDINNKTYYGILYDTYDCIELPAPQIYPKWVSFSCDINDNKNIIIGKITDIKDNYIVISGISDTIHLKYNDIAHISLSNSPKIDGSNNLIIGQLIKVIPSNITETYPITIYTKVIDVVNYNNKSKIIDIVDRIEKENLTCAEALEEIYRDDTYIYYLPCIKSNNIIVKYENGYQETLASALLYNSVSLSDLDKFGIKYYGYPIKKDEV